MSECKEILKTGEYYNFLTMSPEIMGLRLTKARLESMVTYTVAKRAADIPGWFEAVLPSVITYNPEVSIDPDSYTWLEFTKSDNSQLVIPYEWIVRKSLEVYGSDLVNIEINQVTQEQRVAIASFLGKIGVRYDVKINNSIAI